VNPEFSIVIPTFRRPLLLREALNSVFAQGDISLDIVVVDDSPEGSAAETVRALGDPSVRYVKNPSPSGGVPSKVRNLGLTSCRGAFVHFLDDDDLVPAGYYERLRREFAANPKVGVMFGRVEPFGAGPADQLAREMEFFRKAERRAKFCERLRLSWPFVGQMLFGHVLLVCSSAVLRRACVEAVGGFDPNVALHEDRDFLIRAMRKCGVKFLDCLSLNYRIGYPSLMHGVDPSEQQLALERESAKLLREKYLKAHGPVEYYGLKIATRLLDKIS
jgi:glycosyltransferase involved in cell wall biosynthesis